MTKKNVYEALINFVETGDMSYEVLNGDVLEKVNISPDALKAFAENEIEQLNKKALKAKKRAAAKRAEADELTDKVKAVLTEEYKTITEIVVELDDEEVTAGKVTSRLTKLVNAGEAEKTDVKVDKRTVKGYRLPVGE